MLCDRGAQSEQEQKGKTESAIDKWWAQYLSVPARSDGASQFAKRADKSTKGQEGWYRRGSSRFASGAVKKES